MRPPDRIDDVSEGRRAPFPFFVGCGRSGSTLFRMIFDSHPELAIPDESNFVAALARRRVAYEHDDGFDVDRFLADLVLQRSVRRWGVPEDELRRAFGDRPPVGYADAVREVFAAYARRRGKPRYADKTPRYVMDMPLLAELFPEARFVHVLRDGRDVALSFLDVDFGPDTIGGAALAWRERVEAGRRAAPTLGERYREARYEDLLGDPESVVASLCGFLGLAFDPAMLRYFERSDLAGTTELWKYRHVGKPPTRGMRDWRTQMAPRDVELFEALAGDLLGATGYERTARPSARARARAAGIRLSSRGRPWVRRAWRSARTSGGQHGGAGQPVPRMIAEPRLERSEVLSWLLARRADGEPRVRAFRDEILGGRRLALDEVLHWLAREAGDGTLEPDAVLDIVGPRGEIRRSIVRTGALGRLEALGTELIRSYPWSRGEAVTFVLTGLAPRVEPTRIRVEGGHPIGASTRVVMEIDPAEDPRDVARGYARVRRQMGPSRSSGSDERSLALALHASAHQDADLEASLEAWNRVHPSMIYRDPRRFERDLSLARRRLLDPPW